MLDLDPNLSTWVDEYKAILGSHCQWDRYILVPARNRPLRPRQSTCVITGLPARYKDPVTGIPYASAKAYKILKEVVRGDFVWSKSGDEPPVVAKDKPVVAYDALEMGAYLDRVDEEGASGVLAQASGLLSSQTAAPISASTAAGAPSSKGKWVTAPPLPGGLAPGDEKALIAAATALPAGTTRSGGRRSHARPFSSSAK